MVGGTRASFVWLTLGAVVARALAGPTTAATQAPAFRLRDVELRAVGT